MVVAGTAGGPGVVPALGWAFALGSAPIWASGVHQLVLMALAARRGVDPVPPPPASVPSTAIVMCTADDFDPLRAGECAAQDVPVELVILDDSSTEEGRSRVDLFAQRHPARVIRRGDRRGHKAGNLDNALSVLGDRYRFWVLVDADQTLPPDAVRRLHARREPGVAIVQGRPVPRPAPGLPALLGMLPAVHLAVSQRGRPASWFLGRVALVDVAALRAVGGVPWRVVEDVALTLEMRAAGYRIVDAPEVAGEEDAPVDYRAFRVQQLKYVEGAFELVTRSGSRALRAPIPWSERAEILFAHLLVPMSVAGGAVAVVAGGALASAHAFPTWAGPVSMAAALAPLAAELVRLVRCGRWARAVATATLVPVLYASLLVASLGVLARVCAGRAARFRVTPKGPAGFGIRGRLVRVAPELVVGALTIGAAAAGGMPALLPAVLIPVGAAVALALAPAHGSAHRAVALISPFATRMSSSVPASTRSASRTIAPAASRTTA